MGSALAQQVVCEKPRRGLLHRKGRSEKLSHAALRGSDALPGSDGSRSRIYASQSEPVMARQTAIIGCSREIYPQRGFKLNGVNYLLACSFCWRPGKDGAI